MLYFNIVEIILRDKNIHIFYGGIPGNRITETRLHSQGS